MIATCTNNNSMQVCSDDSSVSREGLLMKTKNKRTTSKSFNNGPPSKKADKVKKTSTKRKMKKSVKFQEEGKLNLIMEIEHINDLDTEESLSRWWSHEEIEELKREWEGDVFLLESGNGKVDPRGLEHKTEEGSWNRYSNTRKALNALFGEIEEQMDELGYTSSDGMPQNVDHEKIAKAYRKACKPTLKEALERAMNDSKAARKYLKDIRSELSHQENDSVVSEAEAKPAESEDEDVIVEPVKKKASSSRPPLSSKTQKKIEAARKKFLSGREALSTSSDESVDEPVAPRPRRKKIASKEKEADSSKTGELTAEEKRKQRRRYGNCSFSLTPTTQSESFPTESALSLGKMKSAAKDVKPKRSKALKRVAVPVAV